MNQEQSQSHQRDTISQDVSASSSMGDLTRLLLEEILNETTRRFAEETSSLSSDLAALKEVAGQYAGAPLNVDPILKDLVLVMVKQHFVKLLDSGSLTQMARSIANSLYEDPRARERVERLWKRLSDEEI